MSREPEVKKGKLVEWEGETCRVLKRRRVSGLAMFQTSEFEVCLETLDRQQLGWVPENELVNISDETSEA
jgi:hypothetical protein